MLAFAAIALQRGQIADCKITGNTNNKANNNVSIKEVCHIFPEASSMQNYKGEYAISDSTGQLIGFVLCTKGYCDSIIGYVADVPLLIGIDNKRQNILDIFLLPNQETASFVETIVKKGFLNNWKNLPITNLAEKNVEAISGATYTSVAIDETIRQRIGIYSKTVPLSKPINWLTIIKIISVLIFLSAALLFFFYPAKTTRYRLALLITAIIILGIWTGDFLSFKLFETTAIYGFSWSSKMAVSILLFLSIVLPLFTNKAFYCSYVCPYGALQELSGKITKKKIILKGVWKKIILHSREIILWIIFIVLISGIEFDTSELEPFTAFLLQQASVWVIVLASIFIILSIFFTKPWCNYCCPTGQILEYLRKPIKTNINQSKQNGMKNFYLIIILLCTAIVIILLNPFQSKTQTTSQPMLIKQKSTVDVIFSRKSVRHFIPGNIGNDTLELLVKCGMAAPSAMNRQPWKFIIVNDKKVMQQLCDSLPYAKMLANAAAAIIVCGDLSKAGQGKASEYWIQDCSAATQNILLAVESMGLGAVWTGVYPNEQRTAAVKKIVGIPAHVIPLNVIPVGYPKGDEQPKDKWKKENLHWNLY